MDNYSHYEEEMPNHNPNAYAKYATFAGIAGFGTLVSLVAFLTLPEVSNPTVNVVAICVGNAALYASVRVMKNISIDVN